MNSQFMSRPLFFGHGLAAALKGRHFLSLKDYNSNEILKLLEISDQLKKERYEGENPPYLHGMTLGMVFEKPSTRTRVSFESGIYQLGGMALFLSSQDMQLARKEPIKDTARVLSGYLDGIMVRTFEHALLEEFATYSSVPVINGLTDTYHPCQVMADLMTIKEEFGKLKGIKVTYLGDGNNMANSMLIGCAKMGMDIRVASPKKYFPEDSIVSLAKQEAEKSQGRVLVTDDSEEALTGTQVVATDVWVSMGDEESAKAQTLQDFEPYQVNDGVMKLADKDAIVLHCLPAHRGEEITEDVLEGKQSRVFRQAENRLHAQKGVMLALMG